MTARLPRAPGTPHPQPLSRKGRGGKTCGARPILYASVADANVLPPSPLAGEGLGVRGPAIGVEELRGDI